MLSIAIMQPYFFPYIGYFQLMNAVDIFVVYDNIQYTKRGWMKRNRILANGKDEYISIPIKKAPYHLCVKDRFLSNTWPEVRKRMLNKIAECYRKAPFFNHVYPMIKRCLIYENSNLFEFILNSLIAVKDYLHINTKFMVSSSIDIDHEVKGQDKVIAICKAIGAEKYINPISGVELYQRKQFENEGIQLRFIESENVQYPQFKHAFVPFLSIIDVMMFNDKKKIEGFLALNFTIQ